MDDKHPVEERQSPQDYFRGLLQTVVGQAFSAAGYELQHEPMRWIGGRYRYTRTLESGLIATIEFQVLVYSDNEWTAGQSSRFMANLIRSDKPGARPSKHPQYVQRSLSQLVVSDFGVAILPDADYWWQFHDTDSLGKALAEAGHLIIGYALPYLSGDLLAGDD